MGWINVGYKKAPRTNYEQFLKRDEAVKAGEIAHIDDIENPPCSKDIPSEDLPFIPAETVRSRHGKGDSKLCVSAVKSF